MLQNALCRAALSTLTILSRYELNPLGSNTEKKPFEDPHIVRSLSKQVL
jgi:hypothetical protein